MLLLHGEIMGDQCAQGVLEVRVPRDHGGLGVRIAPGVPLLGRGSNSMTCANSLKRRKTRLAWVWQVHVQDINHVLHVERGRVEANGRPSAPVVHELAQQAHRSGFLLDVEVLQHNKLDHGYVAARLVPVPPLAVPVEPHELHVHV